MLEEIRRSVALSVVLGLCLVCLLILLLEQQIKVVAPETPRYRKPTYPVILGNVTALTTATGDVYFGSTVNGPYDLGIIAGGTATFGRAVRMAPGSPSNSLTVNATGGINLNGGAVNTTLSQTYNNAVILGANTTLTTAVPGTGDVYFGSTVNGQYGLGITAGGSVTFTGAVGLGVRWIF